MIVSVPLVAFDPLHDPVAVQPVAFEELQLIVTDSPKTIELDDKEIETVGAGVVGSLEPPPPPPPPPHEVIMSIKIRRCG